MKIHRIDKEMKQMVLSKSNNQKEEEPTKHSRKEIALCNQDLSVLDHFGCAVPDDALLFYREFWAGKAEHGAEWIFLIRINKGCLIKRISFYCNDYGNPPAGSLSKNEFKVPCDNLKKSDVIKMISLINEVFNMSVSKDNCIDDETYMNWIKEYRDKKRTKN